MKTILLAEDDSDDKEFLEIALSSVAENFTLHHSINGRELLEHLESDTVPPPDLILLDINMPGADGRDCLYNIRKHPVFSNYPVVIVTTNTEPSLIDEMHRLGADYYISKPNSLQEYCDVLKKLMTMQFPDHRQQRVTREDFELKGN